MVEKRLGLEPEVQLILQSIDDGRHFLLSGGAGSGKTYSLVSVIRQVIAENPTAKVACMTYTNSAVKEIEERVNHNNLNVSTIHDFLWDNIKHFQKELKKAIITLANSLDVSKISIDNTSSVPNDFYDNLPDGIQYKEFLKLRDGVISHDELLIIANYLFKKYPKLCSIVKDKYKFIFIDEYQDTDRAVVEIFLDHFRKVDRRNVIGFFGDAMQSIYEDGIGNLDQYKGDETGDVNEITKKQNRRNPQLVIDLANKIRTDGITQEPSSDPSAPNMFEGVIKQGVVLFLHSVDGNVDKIKDFLEEHYAWGFGDSKQTKELNLTHNLIAGKAGFGTLMDIYDDDPVIGLKTDILQRIKDNKKNNRPEVEINDDDTFDVVVDKFQLRNRQRQLKKDILLADIEKLALYNQLKDKPFAEIRKMYLSKDALIDDKKQNEDDENKKGSKRDYLIRHLFKIQTNISLYTSKRFNEFLRATDYRFKLTSIDKKRDLKEKIESLLNVGDKSIKDIIKEANDRGICLIDDKLVEFEEKNEYLYNRVTKVRFSEFQRLYEYLEGKTPFSTQHKTKGAEFDNVLVILDNGGWNNYNFGNLFLEAGSATVLDRTQKIFYVCCTRAKEKLAVFFHNPDSDVIDKAREWFGETNVIDIDGR